MKRGVLTGAAALGLLLTQNTVLADSQTGYVLNHIVVTATGQMAQVRDVQASVEVVDTERLQRFGDGGVTQSLKQAVGVQASNSGATGDISVRGFNRNHTLVLVDGMRRTNNYGGSNPSQMGFFDVERIEIVRGPLSSLYGSEALGGVVNVITRHPGANPGGSAYMATGAARQGRETLRSGINLRAGDLDLGHSLTLEQNFRQRLQHNDSVDDDLGRLNNWSGSYRGRWYPDEVRSISWALEGFKRDSKARAIDTNGPYLRYEDEKRYFASLNYQQTLGVGELLARGSYGVSKGSTNRSHPVVETTDHQQYQSDLIYHLSPTYDHSITLGAGVIRDELDLSINSRSASRNNRFLLAQDQWQISTAWNLVAGIRVDHFDTFGSTTNPRLSLGWEQGDWSARLGYGTAFRAPSLLEQYASFARGRLLIRGNLNLQPEESNTWEAMLRREFTGGYVEIIGHRSRIDGLIDSFTTDEMAGPLRVVEYRNIDRARIQGLELISHWSLHPNWRMTGSMELLDAKNGMTDSRLTGRARQTWRAELQYDRADWLMALRARHMRDYLATEINAPRGAAPVSSNLTRLDASIRYAFNQNLSLFGGIDNLLDKRDPENFSITSAGSQRNDPDARYYHIGVRYEF